MIFELNRIYLFANCKFKLVENQTRTWNCSVALLGYCHLLIVVFQLKALLPIWKLGKLSTFQHSTDDSLSYTSTLISTWCALNLDAFKLSIQSSGNYSKRYVILEVRVRVVNLKFIQFLELKASWRHIRPLTVIIIGNNSFCQAWLKLLSLMHCFASASRFRIIRRNWD